MYTNQLVLNVYGQPTKTVNVNDYTSDFSGHAGGDNRMMEEFVNLIAGEQGDDCALSSIENSAHSHLMALAAERSRVNHGQVVDVDSVGE